MVSGEVATWQWHVHTEVNYDRSIINERRNCAGAKHSHWLMDSSTLDRISGGSQLTLSCDPQFAWADSSAKGIFSVSD